MDLLIGYMRVNELKLSPDKMAILWLGSSLLRKNCVPHIALAPKGKVILFSFFTLDWYANCDHLCWTRIV